MKEEMVVLDLYEPEAVVAAGTYIALKYGEDSEEYEEFRARHKMRPYDSLRSPQHALDLISEGRIRTIFDGEDRRVVRVIFKTREEEEDPNQLRFDI